MDFKLPGFSLDIIQYFKGKHIFLWTVEFDAFVTSYYMNEMCYFLRNSKSGNLCKVKSKNLHLSLFVLAKNVLFKHFVIWSNIDNWIDLQSYRK